MKNKILFLVFICCIILSSCRQEVGMTEMEQSGSLAADSEESTSDNDGKENDAVYNDGSLYEEINVEDNFKIFHCKIMRYEIGGLIDVEINYPQISYDIDMASVINSQIYEKVVDDDIAVWHDTRFNYYLDYEVTYVSDSTISILFKNDNECYGVNYNLETGEEIKIGQYVSSDVVGELLRSEKNSFFEGILRRAIEDININDNLTDFFIWEKGIGLIAWPAEGGGKDYIIIYINLEEKEITWEI